MHKSWVCMTIISTNIMQSLSHTHSITVLIQAPLDRDKTCSESLAAYLKMPYPELLECHEVLHFTQYVFFPTTVPQILLKLYLKSTYIYKYIVQKSDFKNFKEEKHLLEEGMVQKENINPLYENR